MPTIAEVIIQEQRKRLEGFVSQMEDMLATLRSWAAELGSTGQKQKTITEMAEIVLREHGKPLPAKEIVKRIMEKFNYAAKAGTTGTMMWRKAKARRVFMKEPGDTNTYGLREWQK